MSSGEILVFRAMSAQILTALPTLARLQVLRGRPLLRSPPPAVQALAIRDEQRFTGAVVGAHRERSREIGSAVTRDDDRGQPRRGGRAQPRCGTGDGKRVLRGYPELPQRVLM